MGAAQPQEVGNRGNKYQEKEKMDITAETP